MKLNPSIKNMSNEYIFFTDQTALTFRICLVNAGCSLVVETYVAFVKIVNPLLFRHSRNFRLLEVQSV